MDMETRGLIVELHDKNQNIEREGKSVHGNYLVKYCKQKS